MIQNRHGGGKNALDRHYFRVDNKKRRNRKTTSVCGHIRMNRFDIYERQMNRFDRLRDKRMFVI